ncbi:MAG: hypothetical protein GXY44_15725 [Phycisphaerales bacterium]|nr:hypothetical protein [Phycisphaerales bacterium]
MNDMASTAKPISINWKCAAAVLEDLRRDRIRRTDTVEAVAAFDGLFEQVLATAPKRYTSGLVEQQAWFAKARREQPLST